MLEKKAKGALKLLYFLKCHPANLKRKKPEITHNLTHNELPVTKGIVKFFYCGNCNLIWCHLEKFLLTRQTWKVDM